MKLLCTYSLLLLMFLGCFQATADIGATHSLLEKRNGLLRQIELLGSVPDSASKDREQIEILKSEVIALDHQLVASYEQTVTRLSDQRRKRTADDRMLTWLSIVACFIAIGLIILMLLARSRIVKNGNAGLLSVYRELGAELLNLSSPEKSGHPKLLRVNLVVMASLIMMCFSILAYLARSL